MKFKIYCRHTWILHDLYVLLSPSQFLGKKREFHIILILFILDSAISSKLHVLPISVSKAHS
jgi:hypothetical protein